MGRKIHHSSEQKARARAVWGLVRGQHGLISRRQLLDLGFSRQAIEHRLRIGRLHRVRPGVYMVGRRFHTPYVRWMAAVLACADGAVLSHSSAAALWRIGTEVPDLIELSLPSQSRKRHPGLWIHRREGLADRDLTTEYGIPATTPVRTIIDLALRLDRQSLERMINEADKYNLMTPPRLRRELDAHPGQPGVACLRHVLDRRTFRLTREELERLFLPLATAAGLPVPLTFQIVNGFEVDFHWPALGLVVETDGLRYHRTPAEQARDRVRDQTHTAAGLTQLRFTHEQVKYEPAYVRRILAQVASRLAISMK
ncbi:MAG TPA: type IV toxin-antitoxin system AbiEi family antitoxin domain-containing protein [Solirubrobacterales bacterium]|nr:type IV toxin-antitoxin system AbiEi family antitoxin domain-containing protein [Solirubrobacterales bacterium]